MKLTRSQSEFVDWLGTLPGNRSIGITLRERRYSNGTTTEELTISSEWSTQGADCRACGHHGNYEDGHVSATWRGGRVYAKVTSRGSHLTLAAARRAVEKRIKAAAS